jgi:cytosolic prostaglandin-E synthase
MESTVVPLKWAQHKKVVFLTLEAKNLSETGRTISLTPEGHLHFEGTNKVTNAHYHLDLNLFEDVVVETTKWKVTDYCIQFSITKKNETDSFWPRLTKEKTKMNFISVDWARWVDEDEADSKQLDYNPEDFDDLPDEDSDDEEAEEADLKDLDEEKKEEEKKE